MRASNFYLVTKLYDKEFCQSYFLLFWNICFHHRPDEKRFDNCCCLPPPHCGWGCVVLNIGRWGGPALKMPERPRKGANFPLKYPARSQKRGQFSVKCPFEGSKTSFPRVELGENAQMTDVMIEDHRVCSTVHVTGHCSA